MRQGVKTEFLKLKVVAWSVSVTHYAKHRRKANTQTAYFNMLPVIRGPLS